MRTSDYVSSSEKQSKQRADNNGTNPITTADTKASLVLSFWFMGLLNNACFVIMLSCAKSISEGGTALVFICNTFPSLLIKLSAPFWFHMVSYSKRIKCAALLFACSFCSVAYFSDRSNDNDNDSDNYSHTNSTMGLELFGVALGSLGGGLGEASLLALAGRLDVDKGGSTLTAFSSGTGLAGVFGYAWHVLFVDVFKMSITQSLVIANFLAISYGAIYTLCLSPYATEELCCCDENNDNDIDDDNSNCKLLTSGTTTSATITSFTNKYPMIVDIEETEPESSDSDFSAIAEEDDENENNNNNCSYQKQDPLSDMEVDELNTKQRTRLVFTLWPYMVPLFVVYASEYALQSGVWTAIGFPVDAINARGLFYEYSNWTYQIGVFISRSSGTIYQASLPMLWLMPAIQCANLIFFCYTAITHIWYSWSLLSLCFLAGLLGGGVYVNAFTRINIDVPSHQREFALASASVADSLGILLANIVGLFIQSCLYEVNNIDGAIANCPL